MDGSTDRLWERLGALSGMLAIVLGFVGFGLLANSSTFIPLGASQEQLARVVTSSASAKTFTALFLEALAQLLLVVFVARLWATLRRAAGDPGWLSTTVQGAGLLFVVSPSVR